MRRVGPTPPTFGTVADSSGQFGGAVAFDELARELSKVVTLGASPPALLRLLPKAPQLVRAFENRHGHLTVSERGAQTLAADLQRIVASYEDDEIIEGIGALFGIGPQWWSRPVNQRRAVAAECLCGDGMTVETFRRRHQIDYQIDLARRIAGRGPIDTGRSTRRPLFPSHLPLEIIQRHIGLARRALAVARSATAIGKQPTTEETAYLLLSTLRFQHFVNELEYIGHPWVDWTGTYSVHLRRTALGVAQSFEWGSGALAGLYQQLPRIVESTIGPSVDPIDALRSFGVGPDVLEVAAREWRERDMSLPSSRAPSMTLRIPEMMMVAPAAIVVWAAGVEPVDRYELERYRRRILRQADLVASGRAYTENPWTYLVAGELDEPFASGIERPVAMLSVSGMSQEQIQQYRDLVDGDL